MPDEPTLKERLATTADLVRQRPMSVRPVCQIVLRLAGDDPRASFAEAKRQVPLWIAKRAGNRQPERAWDGEPFDLRQVGAQRTAAIAIDDPPYWAARLDGAGKDVAQRIRSTEIGLGVNAKSEAIFGCRLYCVSRSEDVPFTPHVPGVVRQIVEVNNGFAAEPRHVRHPFHRKPDLGANAVIHKLSELLVRAEVPK